MSRYILVCAVSAALTLGVLACGDDDDTSGSPTASGATPTETFGDGRTSPPTASVTDAPGDGDDDDEKTAPPEGSEDDPTQAPTAPGDVPTAPPTASVGTPAPQASPSVFADYQGQPLVSVVCDYNPNTAQVVCDDEFQGVDSIYAIDPPIVGQDIGCELLLLETKPVIIVCTSAEPPNTIYYKVPE